MTGARQGTVMIGQRGTVFMAGGRGQPVAVFATARNGRVVMRAVCASRSVDYLGGRTVTKWLLFKLSFSATALVLAACGFPKPSEIGACVAASDCTSADARSVWPGTAWVRVAATTTARDALTHRDAIARRAHA